MVWLSRYTKLIAEKLIRAARANKVPAVSAITVVVAVLASWFNANQDAICAAYLNEPFCKGRVRSALVSTWEALLLANRLTGSVASWIITSLVGIVMSSIAGLRNTTEVVSRGDWVGLVSVSRAVAETIFASTALADSGYHSALIAGAVVAVVAAAVLVFA